MICTHDLTDPNVGRHCTNPTGTSSWIVCKVCEREKQRAYRWRKTGKVPPVETPIPSYLLALPEYSLPIPPAGVHLVKNEPRPDRMTIAANRDKERQLTDLDKVVAQINRRNLPAGECVELVHMLTGTR